jgi:hypothetical protein
MIQYGLFCTARLHPSHPSRQSILRNQQIVIVLHTYRLADSHPLLDTTRFLVASQDQKALQAGKTTAGFGIFGQRTLAGVILAPRQRPLASSPRSPAAGKLQRCPRSTCKVRRAWYCGRHLADETRAKQTGPVRNSGRCAGTLNFQRRRDMLRRCPDWLRNLEEIWPPLGFFLFSHPPKTRTLLEPFGPFGEPWNPFQGAVSSLSEPAKAAESPPGPPNSLPPFPRTSPHPTLQNSIH